MNLKEIFGKFLSGCITATCQEGLRSMEGCYMDHLLNVESIVVLEAIPKSWLYGYSTSSHASRFLRR
jgi:hypothetical protein